jgi:hypothetical protein
MIGKKNNTPLILLASEFFGFALWLQFSHKNLPLF